MSGQVEDLHLTEVSLSQGTCQLHSERVRIVTAGVLAQCYRDQMVWIGQSAK